MNAMTPTEFFYRHAGFSYTPRETPTQGRRRCARVLAKAERIARERGLSFHWEHDGLTSAEWLDDSDERVRANGGHWRTWECTMRDADGNLLDSIGGVDFGPDGVPWRGEPYRRVVEAELAAGHLL